jgi:sporulation protein YlmC with PRC-barrel domain
MTKWQSLACLAALAATGTLQAQQVIPESTTVRVQTAPVQTQAPQLRRVSQILGSSVQLQGGAAYGKVQDVVLNETGMVEYVVVSNEGRLVMLPWSAANVDFGQRVVTYDVTPQAVQPLSFAPDAFPAVADEQYSTRVRQVFPRAVRTQVVPGTVAPALPADAEKVKIKERNGNVKIKVKDRD